MFRKTILALAATATIGIAALAPTSASACYGRGYARYSGRLLTLITTTTATSAAIAATAAIGNAERRKPAISARNVNSGANG